METLMVVRNEIVENLLECPRIAGVEGQAREGVESLPEKTGVKP